VYLTLEAIDDVRDTLLFAMGEWGLDAANAYREMLDKSFAYDAKFPEWNLKKDDVQEGIETSGIGQHITYVRTYDEAVHILRVLHVDMNATHYWDIF
jgi:plasmid stabilization system protein ParE